jgi:hypothetical protein
MIIGRRLVELVLKNNAKLAFKGCYKNRRGIFARPCKGSPFCPVFLSRQKSGEKSDPLARVTQAKRAFSRRRPNSPSALAQTMSAFTLKKPRPLGTRKRGFGSTEFNGQTVLTI